MLARFITATKLADYYAVSDPDRAHLISVRHGCHPTRPFLCGTCHSNDCKHIDAVEMLILAGGGAPSTTNASVTAA